MTTNNTSERKSNILHFNKIAFNEGAYGSKKDLKISFGSVRLEH